MAMRHGHGAGAGAGAGAGPGGGGAEDGAREELREMSLIAACKFRDFHIDDVRPTCSGVCGRVWREGGVYVYDCRVGSVVGALQAVCSLGVALESCSADQPLAHSTRG